MKKVELLAPAGSMEALIAAVQNGCDALYLGGSAFGARAFANNFDREEMVEAIQYAHSYGVKVYVTMNTLIMEEEMAEAIAYAKFLYEQEVDALIIQDLGLFDVLHQNFPDLELHASTQMHIHNRYGIDLMKEAGAKRVVVPRETSIEEIAEMAKANIDLEVFVQGALCVSYSGQCLMSAKKLSRSGNRGECAQMCRMRYRLGKLEQGTYSYIDEEGEYLLSPKDLNTLKNVPELIRAGIASFKIEGRMKRPAYVALMVSLYRKAIDAYYAKEKFHEPQAEMEMRKIFNRDFTSGHLFHQKGSALMNFHRPNHMGIPVGKVSYGKAKRICVVLSDTLRQGDGIRFLGGHEDQGCMVNKMYKKGLLVNAAYKGDTIELEYSGYVEKGSVVVKTSDKVQLEELQATYEKPQRRVRVDMQVDMHKAQKLHVIICDEEGFQVEGYSESNVEKAVKTPLDQERLSKQLKKCGDTIFTVESITFSMDEDAIISIKEVNQLRRELLEALTMKRKLRTYPKRYGTYARHIQIHQEQKTYCVVHRKEQYEVLKDAGFQHLYIAGNTLYQQIKAQDISVGYYGDRVMKHAYPEKNTIFCENGGIGNADIADHFVNITNSYSAAFLFAHGVKAITFSNEVDEHAVANILKQFQSRYQCSGNFILHCYGKEELMISEYCPINTCIKDNQKQNCGLCKGSTRYYLEDIQGQRYPLFGDDACRMHILDSTAKNTLDEHNKISTLLIFHDETAVQIKALLQTHDIQR